MLRLLETASKEKIVLAVGLMMAGGYSLDQLLKYRATSSLLHPITQKLEEGSKPHLPIGNTVDRSNIWKALERTFLIGSGTMKEGFGIVFGPSSSGKTMAIRRVCNDNPNGVLYVELKGGMTKDHSFVDEMIAQLNIKTKPHGIIDLVLGYLSQTYVTHHQLPTEPWSSMDYVFKVLSNACVQYKRKHHSLPVIFIDGCDALAKSNKEMFMRLVPF